VSHFSANHSTDLSVLILSPEPDETMRMNTTNETATQTPIRVGLTSKELARATDGGFETELNLTCCHIAINEFELVFLASN
jgi:hypothetical protein